MWVPYSWYLNGWHKLQHHCLATWQCEVRPIVVIFIQVLFMIRVWPYPASHASEPYIPINPYRCPRKFSLALYSLYSHIQALFIPLKPYFLAKEVQSNDICIIFMKFLEIFFQISPTDQQILWNIFVNFLSGANLSECPHKSVLRKKVSPLEFVNTYICMLLLT